MDVSMKMDLKNEFIQINRKRKFCIESISSFLSQKRCPRKHALCDGRRRQDAED